MKRRSCALLFAGLLLAATVALPASHGLLMVRSPQDFPETMLLLQESIKAHGYQLARVQRVDIGLTTAGFETDKYRIVFYGKATETGTLLKRWPLLAPFLPLKFSVFAEGEETIVVAADPGLLAHDFDDPGLKLQFSRWRSDIRSILADLRQAD